MRIFTPRLLVLSLVAAAALAGCDDDPTTAIVENALAATPDAGTAAPTTVYKVWWLTTLFERPVAAGAASERERTIPGADFAYALLAPGWSPGDGGRPQRLVAIKSTTKLSVATHDTLRIVVSDDTFTGDCASGAPLDADDARLVTERLFPGDFAGVVYDPATCTTTPVASDGGNADSADLADDGG
jgi:hypothetical protein